MNTRLDSRDSEVQPTMRRSLVLGCLLLGILCGACKPKPGVGGDNRGTPPAAVAPAGTYALVSVDGSAVPCRVVHDGHPMTIQSGQFLIQAEGACRSRMYLEGRDQPIEVQATFTQAGAKLTMKWQGAGMTAGRIDGDTFTMTNEGMVLVYRK